MTVKESISSFIKKNSHQLFSDYLSVDSIEILIKKQSVLGFNIILSPRFICYLKGYGSAGVIEEKVLLVKNRLNVDVEYSNMKMLWEAHYFRNGSYSIPKPLFLDRQNSLLFMQYLKGESFLNSWYKKLILTNRNNMDFVKKIKLAAGWLVDFQKQQISSEKKSIPEELLGYEIYLEKISAINNMDKVRIIEKLDETIGLFPQDYETYVHGQYQFRNIIFYNEKICVVDFVTLRRGWRLYDFFTFLLGLDRLSQYPLISRSDCENMKNIFISEYFDKSCMEYHEEMFDALWASFVLAYLRNIYRPHGGIRGMLNNKFVNDIFKRLISWSRK